MEVFHISKQVEIDLPPKVFPSSNYETIKNKICNQRQKDIDKQVSEFSYAWMAVMYHFCTCAESNQGFTESFKKFGDRLSPSERYNQEKELFHFFVNGYSTLDCFAYALYMIASIIKPIDFPIYSSILKQIYITNIGSKNGKYKNVYYVFPNEEIINKVNKLIESSEFDKWNSIRNALIHRISPGRILYLKSKNSKKKEKASSWIIGDYSFDIDEYLTSSRFYWLANNLSNLMDATQVFIAKYIS
jgi:hypothetical protein